MPRVARTRSSRSSRLLVLALPVVVAVSALPVDHATAAAGASADTSWFQDPLTTTQRGALLPVPAHPRTVHGKLRATQALYRSHDGSLAVPAVIARGHQLYQGQAVTLSQRTMFTGHTSRPTRATRLRVTALATSMSWVTAVSCEGYTDFAGSHRRGTRLATQRAVRVCSMLATARPGVATTASGFGRHVPVLVGGRASERALNRRVVVVVTGSRSGSHPPAPQATAPGAPTLTSVTGGGRTAALAFTAPDDGGSPITGYQWRTDQSTWTPLSTIGSSPYTVPLGSLPAGTRTYYVRAVNAVGNGPASAGVPGTVLEVPNAPSVLYTNVFCNGSNEIFNQINADPVFNTATITGVEYRLDDAQSWTSPGDLELISNEQYRWSLTEAGLCTGSHTIEMRFTSANGPGASVLQSFVGEEF